MDDDAPREAPSDPTAERLRPYVPRTLQQHLLVAPDEHWWTAEGTAVFADISGFTQLSERLARRGREGAEQITDAIGGSFESILLVAYQNGGGLLKFGGDALLIWFHGDDHVARACRAAVLMRRVLQNVGRIEVPGAKVQLRVSQGVHTGTFHFFAVGTSYVEFLPVGPGWSRLVAAEHAATAGQILVTPATAACLPPRCVGEAGAAGSLLRREPPGYTGTLTLTPPPALAPGQLQHCLPPSIREHVLAGGGVSEHRPVTVAFLRFEGTDAMIDRDGPAAVADALRRLVDHVAAATAERGVSVLSSDVDADGGKLILTAGAPNVTGDDEERMLLALRGIVEGELPFPIRIGVNRGAVFAGDIGPGYRRTYTVMGDAVNLAARLMAKASPGAIYATAEVIENSTTAFANVELPPFAVKGKAQPVQAWALGKPIGAKTRSDALIGLPLIGRDAELASIRDALAAARSGAGRLVEIAGEVGIGKSRMLEALRDEASGWRRLAARCEAYSASSPYAVWHELMRELLAVGSDAADDDVEARLRVACAGASPELAPWLPLVAIAAGIDVAPTPEVELLADEHRRPRLHEAIAHFLAAVLPAPTVFEIDDAQHMDEASAELLGYLAGRLAARPWVVAVARRATAAGFVAEASPDVVRIPLGPLAPADAAKMARLATQATPLPIHAYDVVTQRSGGNPAFLRDLLRLAIASGGVGGLPESAEAAAMARIDALAPDDRALLRRAAVFGIRFHPRMLRWLDDEDPAPEPGAEIWARLESILERDDDGVLQFRRALIRDAAYESLPYKLRRRLHRAAASHLEREADDPEEIAGVLALHYDVAGDYEPALRFAAIAAQRAQEIHAHVEAAGLFGRALDAARRLGNVGDGELAALHEAHGDSWDRAGEFRKAAEAYTAARRLVGRNRLHEAVLLLKRSRLEEKLGKYRLALQWSSRALKALDGLHGEAAARETARAIAWYATVLQAEGRPAQAVRWADRAIVQAAAVDDDDALGAAYFVKGWAHGASGAEGADELLQRSLAAYQRAGNRVKQAALLSNLGVACQWDGRWDEAMDYYGRGRDECLKVGDVVGAAVARMNIAEILVDRGELAEATELLAETLPIWRASQYRYFLGGCLWLWGRALIRGGDPAGALAKLDEARAHFAHVGSEHELRAVDARVAECRLAAGDTEAALALVAETYRQAGGPKGAAMIVSLLERIRGEALLRQDRGGEAAEAFAASLATARARNDRFEILQTLQASLRAARRQGRPPEPAWVAECAALQASLKVSDPVAAAA